MVVLYPDAVLAVAPSLVSVTTTITVDLGDRSYPVLVGHGARSELSALIPAGVKRGRPHPGWHPVAGRTGVASIRIELPDGEAAKSLSVVEDVCRQLAGAGFTRADAIVAVGGGVVTDVGGFVASVYHRGIRFVSVSTTLLGQVDAAIGGKTGVNLPEGKNLVGAFWQPSAVICDTETLETLPHREFQCGVGEIAKYHFLGGGRLDELPIDERVAACVQIKADVVMADEREGEGGPSSTTATPSLTPSKPPAPTTSVTVRRSPSASGTPRRSPAVSAVLTMTESPSTSGSCGLRTADDRARAAHRHRVDGPFLPRQEGDRRCDLRARRTQRRGNGRRCRP